MTPLRIRNLEIGEGIPKIVVPIMGAHVEALLDSAHAALDAGADIIEWRVDFLNPLEESRIVAALGNVRDVLGETPLLFTLRSASQGGEADLSDEAASRMIRAALATGAVDLVDIELDCAHAEELVAFAHEFGVHTVVSRHDFKATPSFDQIYDLFQRELDAGADMAKVAVMACEEGDELRLMAACSQFAADNPHALLVGIAMGEKGIITRVAGEFFGSCLTFCSAGDATAPGQLNAAVVRASLAQLHESGYNPTSTE